MFILFFYNLRTVHLHNTNIKVHIHKSIKRLIYSFFAVNIDKLKQTLQSVLQKYWNFNSKVILHNNLLWINQCWIPNCSYLGGCYRHFEHVLSSFHQKWEHLDVHKRGTFCIRWFFCFIHVESKHKNFNVWSGGGIELRYQITALLNVKE